MISPTNDIPYTQSDGKESGDSSAPKAAPENAAMRPSHELDIFEVDMPVLGSILISFPAPVCKAGLHFFLHYGHPVRGAKLDRMREVACMAIVYAYVLNFSAGLIALSWMNSNTQYLWLAYQVYTTLTMHIVRLCGWQGCGRTEENTAKVLPGGKTAYLVGTSGAVRAILQIEPMAGVTEGEARVKEILLHNHLDEN